MARLTMDDATQTKPMAKVTQKEINIVVEKPVFSVKEELFYVEKPSYQTIHNQVVIEKPVFKVVEKEETILKEKVTLVESAMDKLLLQMASVQQFKPRVELVEVMHTKKELPGWCVAVMGMQSLGVIALIVERLLNP